MKKLLTLILPFIAPTILAQSLSIQQINEPQLSLESFDDNQVGYLGNFDATSFYTYVGQSNFTNQNTLSNNLYYVTGDENNEFISIGSINGAVSRIVPIGTDIFLLLGNFDSIGDKEVSSPAFFNITSNEFKSLDPEGQIDGTINTALYDSDENIVYLGGDFSFNETESIAIYSIANETLSSSLFEGFGTDSTINSILKVGDNIIFGGQFSTLGLPELLSSTYNTSNISVETDQLVSFKYATFSSSDGSSTPDAVSCPGGNEWEVSGVSAATLNIALLTTVIPSKIRVYNSADTDSQISLFRLITAPANGIMNLTYVDPSTGELAVCDAWCPLLDSSSLGEYADDVTTVPYGDTSLTWSTSYQEFGFVNSIDVSTVIFQALDSYGSNIALSGFQIYQSLFSTYANNSLNEPSCESDYSKSETVGDWAASSSGSYLVSEVDSSDFSDVGVTFYPNISYAGEYSILIYTPGCSSDETCDSRGIVNVSLSYIESGELVESTLLYQTNTEEKYDSLFYGHLDGAVQVDLSIDSAVSSTSDIITFVADRVSVTIYSIDEIVNENGTVPINGIFEYSISNFTSFDASDLSNSTYIGNSTINQLGGSLSESANISLALYNGSIYVAGDFTSPYGDNLLSIEVDESKSTESALSARVESVNGGLNGVVSSVSSVDAGVVLIGDFTGTNNDSTVNSLDASDASLGGVALYNGSWYGFDEDLSTISFVNVTIFNQEYWIFSDSKWNNEDSSWFNDSSLLSFNVTAAGFNENSLFAGSLSTSEYLANKGIFVDSSSNQTNITSDELEQSEFLTGWYINESLSVFGGEFNTSNAISNLIFSDGETRGLDIDWNTNASVTKLFTVRDTLFIGSGSGGAINGAELQGVLIYDLSNQTFSSSQPESLSKSGSTPKIYEFGYLNSTYLVVAGDFDSAGSSDTSGLAFYNLNESSWESLIDSFTGSVYTFRFVDTTIIAGGDISYDGDDLKLFAYDFNSTNTSQPNHFSDVQNTVTNLILVDNSTTGRLIISGDDFISAYDGSSWTSIDRDFNNATISDIVLLDLEDSNSSNNESFFDSSSILVASGSFDIEGYGYANVAFFNSTHWVPYLITTKGTSSAAVESIFLNKDISSWYISGSLSNSTSTPKESTTSSATPSTSASESQTPNVKTGKMDRGFIVLVGLASAVGTMGVLGAAGALLLFKKKKNDYTSIEPRVNETEMLDTVPPETLLKHI